MVMSILQCWDCPRMLQASVSALLHAMTWLLTADDVYNVIMTPRARCRLEPCMGNTAPKLSSGMEGGSRIINGLSNS